MFHQEQQLDALQPTGDHQGTTKCQEQEIAYHEERTDSPTSDVGTEASFSSCLENSQRLASCSPEPEIDIELVESLRTELRRDCIDDEQFKGRHLEELLNPEFPFTCWRYLKHCNLDIKQSLDLCKAAMKWRKENQADESLNSEMAKEFWFHAPMSICGKTRRQPPAGESPSDSLEELYGQSDRGQHDIVYTIGKHYRKPDSVLSPIIVRYCQNILFNWDREHEHDLEQFCFVFDVSETGFRNIDLDFMRWLISVRDFLPDRIAKIHVIGVPFLVRPLIKLIISWLPEKFSKLVECGTFEQLTERYVDLDQLPREVGGQLDEELYRMAPVDAIWVHDSPLYSSAALQKAVHDSMWFHVTEEREQRLRRMQESHEARLKASSCGQ